MKGSLLKDLVGEGLAASSVELDLIVEDRKILSFGSWISEET